MPFNPRDPARYFIKYPRFKATTTHRCCGDRALCVCPALERNVVNLTGSLHGAVPRAGLDIFGTRTGTLRQVCIAPKAAVARQHSRNAAPSGLVLQRNCRSRRRSIPRSSVSRAAWPWLRYLAVRWLRCNRKADF